jgi:glycosyltransferase involved in cell wall biosynthesis
LRSKLEKQITDFDLIDKVELLGLREDIPELLAKADCFLLPSLWEGMPIVLLEAGASNIPIISTNVGSISSLIDNETGYLVTLEQFKAQMIYLIENQTESKQKALKLRNKIEQQYSIESVVTKYEDIYSSLFN